MPRSVSARASAQRLVTPDALRSAMTGSSSAARASDRAASAALPAALPFSSSRAPLRPPPSFTPRAFAAASAAPGAICDEPPFPLGERRVQVQHERVRIHAELRHNEEHALLI